jgi:wyosine [tRNA(Phe)-imidazoG37] synthetase (radical SAM superfamily)
VAISIPLIPEGTRVKVKRGRVPQDPALTGRAGTVVIASEYRPQAIAIALDGEPMIRYFMPDELEVTRELPLPPEREAAKLRSALP